MNNTISIIAIILFITLCFTLYAYVDLTNKMQQFQYDRLKHIVNIQNEIKLQSESLLEKKVCNEKLETCSSQLGVNSNVISEIRKALQHGPTALPRPPT
jgi:hypothetical protein